VTRLAAPMARRDMTFDSAVDFASSPGSGQGIVKMDRPTPVPSTFRHGVGQVVPFEEAPTLAPKSGRRVVLAIMGGVAIAGLAIVLIGRGKREPRRTTAVAETMPARPAARATAHEPVRINFTSDPDGATVFRGDHGSELGTTPLSIEVPYSDSPVQFILRKSGFEDKAMFIVPNLPAPMFASLRPIVKAPAPAANPNLSAPFRRMALSSANRKAAAAAAAAAANAATANQQPAQKKIEKRPPAGDEDAVLEPDFK